MRCEFKGCKHEARWTARKLWGKGGEIRTCDAHRPDPDKRSESLRHLPFFYRVEPIAGEAR
jgi:hypothetical protein